MHDMKHKRFTFLNQNGFAPSLALLALAVITLIALIGVYVYQRQQDDKPISVTQQSESKKSPSESSQKQAATTQDLKIPEFGIALPIPSNLKGVSYGVNSQDGATVGLTVEAFSGAVAHCVAPNTLIGSSWILGISKRAGQYTPAMASELPFETFAQQFDDFYLTIVTPDGGLGSLCDPSKTAELAALRQVYDQVRPQLITAIKSAKSL